jgi:uncharacterized membrane protein
MVVKYKTVSALSRRGGMRQASLAVACLAAVAALGAVGLARTRDAGAYDLSTYPFDSWAQLQGINNLNVAVGLGDVAGDVRMFGVRLPGAGAGSWFESGVSSNDDIGWAFDGMAISDTGLIVGGVRDAIGMARAYAWGAHRPGLDLGTLPGDTGSVAFSINHAGTLIVGVSLGDMVSSPVVWTRAVSWRRGWPTLVWQIHELPTGGLDETGRVWPGVTLNWWGAWGVNDRGQIVGDAWSNDYDEIALVWSLDAGGRGWHVEQLPHQSASADATQHLYTEALSINDLGDIAGDVSLEDGWSADLPAVWKASPVGSRRGARATRRRSPGSPRPSTKSSTASPTTTCGARNGATSSRPPPSSTKPTCAWSTSRTCPGATAPTSSRSPPG